MLLRGMNPQIIAMDEISSPEDVETVYKIMGCGVTLYATAHGRSLEDMEKREIYCKLLAQGFFRNQITISVQDGQRDYLLETI